VGAKLRGLIAGPSDSRHYAAEVRGPATDAEQLGEQLARALLDQGAGDLLRELGLQPGQRSDPDQR